MISTDAGMQFTFSQLHHLNADSPSSAIVDGDSNSIEQVLSSENINSVGEMKRTEDGIRTRSPFPK
jgi:hypothetical protein